jgi:hypothetical protein
MTKRPELPAQMMGTDTRFHADQAGWHIGKACLNLATRPLLAQHNCAAPIKADYMERVLADIDADYGDCTMSYLGHGVLLVFGAPSQLHSLAGQEHGRTIPLPDVTVLLSKNEVRAEAIQLR